MKRLQIGLISFAILFALMPVSAAHAVTQTQISATVHVLCPVGNDLWSSGTGTVIDPKGVVLTNRHVVEGATKCVIGFVHSVSETPNYYTNGQLNVAEVKYISSAEDLDASLLYLTNPTPPSQAYINIWAADSSKLRFGDRLEVVGFPSIGGSTLTYSSGDFSGFGNSADGTQNYIKSNAIIAHGNSGGGAYTVGGSFAGVPTFVLPDDIASISYLLSVNAVKSWLTGILGPSYQQVIPQQQGVVAQPPAQIQADTEPPYATDYLVSFWGKDADDKDIYQGLRYGDTREAIYEFNRVQFGWPQSCGAGGGPCIVDDASSIEGYYYYFGTNPNANPRVEGKYISAANLISKSGYWAIPETFTFAERGTRYFMVQAVDSSKNISGNLLPFAYTYEADNFKDIKGFDLRTGTNALLGYLRYPTLAESPGCQAFDFCRDGRILDYTVTTLYTNQDTLTLYPNYGYEIDGLTYYVSYDDDRWWTDKVRVGTATPNKFVKVTNIRAKSVTNLALKPFKDNVNSFLGKHVILQIVYDGTVNGVVPASSSSGQQYRTYLAFAAVDEALVTRMKGRILLQAEEHGEAWYVHPDTGRRHYMRDGGVAYQMMRSFGLGITDKDLSSIPVSESEQNMLAETSVCSSNATANMVKGKILLQVQQHGEAWYVHPDNCRRIYMKDGNAAYQIMRFLSLGISNSNLAKIAIGD